MSAQYKYIRNNHLEKYLPISGMIFTKNKIRYEIQIKVMSTVYPVAGLTIFGNLEEIDCAHEFRFADLGDYETFNHYLDSLDKCLEKYNSRNTVKL